MANITTLPMISRRFIVYSSHAISSRSTSSATMHNAASPDCGTRPSNGSERNAQSDEPSRSIRRNAATATIACTTIIRIVTLDDTVFAEFPAISGHSAAIMPTESRRTGAPVRAERSPSSRGNHPSAQAEATGYAMQPTAALSVVSRANAEPPTTNATVTGAGTNADRLTARSRFATWAIGKAPASATQISAYVTTTSNSETRIARGTVTRGRSATAA